jgi:hypothetical protein
MSGFKVVKKHDEGKVVIATKDFLPGEIVFREEPLLYVSVEQMDTLIYEHGKYELFGIERVIWASEKAFRQDLTPKQQITFLNLYYPSSGNTSDETRNVVQNMIKLNKWDDQKIETLIKIAMIYAFNAFSVKGTRRVYEHCSRINHSCQANCRIDFPNGKKAYAVWTAVSPIKTGDEMTITYGAYRFDLKPTTLRCDYYMWSKEFLCECPRCCALGDDTRQFNCSNADCSGRHFAAQSTSGSAAYLLPCFKCRTTPGNAFQSEMLLWESCSEDFKTHTVNLVAGGHHTEPHAIPYPDCHLKSFPLSQALYERARGPEARLALAKRFIKPIELVSLPPNAQHCEWFAQAAGMFLKTRTTEGVVLARNYARRALRDLKVMFGRNTLRTENVETTLCTALSRLPQQDPTVSECMFCGESPDRAFLTLKKCGECGLVAYCGARCQVSHWKFHKTVCIGTRARRRTKKGVHHGLFCDYVVETVL